MYLDMWVNVSSSDGVIFLSTMWDFDVICLCCEVQSWVLPGAESNFRITLKTFLCPYRARSERD